MTHDEAQMLYAIQLQRAQQQPQASRALPQYAYGDPAKTIKFERERGARVQSKERKEKAEALLLDWYVWSKSWRPALGAPQATSYRREMALEYEGCDSDEADEDAHREEMKAVEFCVDALPLPHRQAIGIEMKNRAGRVRVWRSSSPVRFEDALYVCMAVMRKRNLL